MKKFFLFLISPFIFSTAQSYEVNFNKLIENEYKFSERASIVGIRNSFLEFIAEDGILFRPTPVNGKEFLLNQKNPSKGLLSWYPEIAYLSESEDFGFTTGPWEYRKGKDSAAVAFGNFATIWELQEDGSFKFVIDIGNSNSQPEQKIRGLDFTAADLSQKKMEVEHGDAKIILEVDNDFNNSLNNQDLNSAYKKYSDEKTRLLRDGVFPIIGIDSISSYLNTLQGNRKYYQTDGEVSHAGDLGYTYGIIEKFSQDKLVEKYAYMRVYIKKSSQWKLALEVYNKTSK